MTETTTSSGAASEDDATGDDGATGEDGSFGAANVAGVESEDWEVVEDDWGRVYDVADEYVAVPKESGRGRRVLLVLGGILALFALVVGSFGFWVNRQVDPPGPAGEAVEIEVPEGATLTELAGDLEEAGIIGNGLVFRFYARRKGFEEVQAGVYDAFHMNSSMGDVISVLEAGPAAPPAAAQLTFPEGLELADLVGPAPDGLIMANLGEFDHDELGEAMVGLRSTYMPDGVTNLEGFLFPDTYRIEEGDEDDERKLLDQMVGQFDATATELGYGESAAAVGLTPYEVVTIASIIEREAKVPEDQPKVARVIYNRLAQGMNLEIDATLLYTIGHTETLTQSDLETDTPYNTRLYPGLPPTPIAMPGRSALDAAIHPADGPWLFYVLADADGSHFFTDDYDEFLRVSQESRDAGLFE